MGEQSPQQIVLVTGKGGVGKSLVAAAMALQESRKGKKVLLAELGKRGFYRHFLRMLPDSDQSPFLPGVNIARWEGRDCLREYVAHLFKLGAAADLFLDNRVVNALIGVAPGVNELALTGKITSGNRHAWSRSPHDLIVVDAYSTGHFLALLRAPRGMHEAIPAGPMGRQCKSIREVLSNPEITRYIVVTLAEELPVTEALELARAIESEAGTRPEILCNKMLPENYECEIGDLRSDSVSPASGFLDYLHERLSTQRRNVEKLKAQYGDVRLVPHCLEADPSRLLNLLVDYL